VNGLLRDGARVLLVEDSATQAVRTQVVLEAGGFAVDIARVGEAAIGMFSTGTYDLVVSDVVMPGMAGYDVCRRIKAIRSVPVVLLTSLSDPLVIMRALEAGADSFVTKPFEAGELCGRLHELLRDRQRRERPSEEDPGSLPVTVLGQSFDVASGRAQILGFFSALLESLFAANNRVSEREAELAAAHAALDTHATALEKRVAESSAEAATLLAERTLLLTRITTVVDSAPILLTTLDQHGLITFAEGAALAPTGRTPQDLIGRSAFEFASAPADRDVIRRALGGETFSATVNPFPDVFYRTHYAPLRDDAGALAGSTAVAIDESERQTAERQNKLLNAAFQSGDDAVAIIELPEGRLVFANPAWELLNRVTREEIIGNPFEDAITGSWDGPLLPKVLAAIRQNRDFSGDVLVIPKSGGPPTDVELRIEMLGDAHRSPSHFVCVMRDIGERKSHERELERLALYDTLSGLPNRPGFERLGAPLLSAARASDGRVSVLALDLDRFKDVNDTFGHGVGDQLLRAVGPRLAALLRSSDVLAHQGADGFLMMLPGCDAVAAAGIARKLAEALLVPHVLEGQRVEVAGSFGVAVFPEHGSTVSELLQKADVALGVAKASGGGVSVYDPATDLHSPARMAMVSDLRDAIEAGALVLHYQPLVDARSGRPRSVEALVRWPHPTRGLVPPLEFIPTAERTGLIIPLTEFVLKTAVAQAVAWQRAGTPIGVAVNVSPRSLYDSGFATLIEELLRSSGLGPSALTIEITEGTIMTRPDDALATLRRLRQLGVDISIDDFGTGYSSLGYIQRLPVTSVKVDRSFVKRMREDPGSLAIVRSTIDLAHNLDLKIVAEGVEDGETLTALADLGCDLAQGYFMCRPVPADDLTLWLAKVEPGVAVAGGAALGVELPAP
jgi:diguanylate cyclase (GGDEF)-like protein/PAS domain S-box-containing protein